MYKLVLFTVFYTALYCSSNRSLSDGESTKCNTCQAYIDYMMNNWKRDSSGYYFFASTPTCEAPDYWKTGDRYTNLLANNCFKGMQKDSIVKILGDPTKVYANRIEYYLNAKCEGKEGFNGLINGCRRLRLYFDGNDRVVGVSGMLTE